jgi:hypothetical protein
MPREWPVWQIIRGLDIVTKDNQPVQNKVVSGTKTLHHLLPELVFPIDREYTQSFFMWGPTSFQYHPAECFAFAFIQVAEIARSVDPNSHVGEGWNSLHIQTS